MSITLIVSRSFDNEFNETGKTIALEEWIAFVNQDNTLRLAASTQTTILKTGEKLSFSVGPGAVEFLVGSDWVALLRFFEGELRTNYAEDFDNPNNPVRKKIVEVARHFGAIIMCDAGDGILDW